MLAMAASMAKLHTRQGIIHKAIDNLKFRFSGTNQQTNKPNGISAPVLVKGAAKSIPVLRK